MNDDHNSFKILARKLDFLVNKLRTSNWGVMIMAVAFAYFYWDSAPRSLLIIWLVLNLIISFFRAIFVYPYYDRTTITSENIHRWVNWFTFTLAITGLLWGLALPFFFNPDDYFLLLILMFTFFTLMVSATITLASHMAGFIAFCLPLMISVVVLLITAGERIHIELGVAFLIFSLSIVHFYRSTNREITELIRLQVDKESFADKLEKEKNSAEHSRKIAEESVQEKNRFLAAASHDLRQPLHASGMLLSMLENHIKDKRGEVLLNSIVQSNQALSHSFNSLMDVSKLDAGVIDVHENHTSIRSILSPIIGEFSQQAEEKSIEIFDDIDDLIVVSDYQLLSRIIRNIFSNAVKYTDSGSIHIATKKHPSGEDFSLTISDTGIGIPQEEQELIFSEYYQLDNPERDREKGFGLGLAIVKRLCQILKIEYSVESKFGKGTTFNFILPLGSAELAEQKSLQSALDRNLEGLHILVIDDDKTVLESMAELLISWGCIVSKAHNGAEAFNLIDDKSIIPNLIISDFRLRDNENGIELCRALQAKLNQESSVLIITGETSPDRLQQAKQSQYPILHKPVSPGELRSFLNQFKG